MKKNYSDGLEFLIKKHVCVLTEMALQQPMEGHYQAIHEKFAKLVRKSEELGISYYYEDEKLRSEQEALGRAVSGLISYLRQHAGEQKPYKTYLWSLDIFSACVYCPYIIERSEIYTFWQFCIINNVI